jgi:cytochrome P450
MITHTVNISPEHRGLNFLLNIKKDQLNYFTSLMHREGAFAWYQLAHKNVLMLNDATGIQHVLQDNAGNYHKSSFYKVLKPFLGNSILLSEEAIWKKQRQESAPAFAHRNFAAMVPQMTDAIHAMLERWQKNIVSQQPLDLNFETMWFTLDVLLRTLFHEQRDGITNDMQNSILTLLREAEERVWRIVSLPQRLTFMLPKYRRSLNFLNKTIDELVATRRANHAYPEDLLSRLITSYTEAPAQQRMLRDQMMTFLLAGHETTANGLVWALYYLSKHPDIWQKVATEADAVLGNRTPTMDDIKQLQYTRQVFDEVLRIHPVVWTLSREAQADDIIPLENDDQIELKRGTVVMLCTYAVHRRTCYWPNPEVFDPERFNTANSHQRPKYSWFPFGGGPRMCVGFRFAQIESIIALAMLAQRYDFSLLPGQNLQPVPTITLRPPGAMYFTVTKRHAAAVSCHPDTIISTISNATCPFHVETRVA